MMKGRKGGRGHDTFNCNTLALNGTVPRVLHLPGRVDLAIDVPETRAGLDSRLRGNDKPGGDLSALVFAKAGYLKAL
jgi:hypothetical protein